MMEKKNRNQKKNKIGNSCLVSSTLINVSGTYRVDLAIEEQRDIVCKYLALFCFVFLGAAPIPNVQAAILNLS